MKNKLILLVALNGCLPLSAPAPVPAPVPVPVPVPIVDRCAPHAVIKSCDSASFGDGKGGTLFKRSDTNRKNHAFLLPGNIQNFASVEVCSDKKCQKMPWVACSNPDNIGERAHYKGPLRLDLKKPWLVKFGTCQLKIKNKERND